MIDSYKPETFRKPPPGIFDVAKRYHFTGTREELFHQVILFDAEVCASVGRGEKMNAVVYKQASRLCTSQMWPNFTETEAFVKEFLWNNRECFHRLLRGQASIDKAPIAYRGAVQAHLLVLMMDQVSVSVWREKIENLFSLLRPRWLGKVREEILLEHIVLYQDARIFLSPEDWKQLQLCREDCLVVAQEMSNTVMRIAEQEIAVNLSAPAPVPTPMPTSVPALSHVHTHTDRHWLFPLNSNTEKLRLLYFLETCSATQLEQGEPWRMCARKNWNDFYPNAPFCKEVEDELWWVLRRRRSTDMFGAYCLATGIVFQYGLGDINSGVHLYHLLLGRAVGMAVAYASESAAGSTFGVASDEILGDALNYRKRVSVSYAMSAQEEEARLREMLALYQRDGRYDAALLADAVSMREVFRKNFRALEKRVQKSNESNILLLQMHSKLQDMESALEKADFDVKSKLIHQLDRGSFGCRLGQLYRFAQGLDAKDTGQVREMLHSFFALLETMGICPMFGERLDQEISETDALFDKIIPYTGLDEDGKRMLQYPGWSVGSVQTEPPVYIVIKE